MNLYHYWFWIVIWFWLFSLLLGWKFYISIVQPQQWKLNCSRLPLRYWKKDISVLSEEKEQAQVSRVAAETELERIRDAADRQTRELSEASSTIKDLEFELSQVESKVNLLTQKNNADQVV